MQRLAAASRSGARSGARATARRAKEILRNTAPSTTAQRRRRARSRGRRGPLAAQTRRLDWILDFDRPAGRADQARRPARHSKAGIEAQMQL